MKNTDPLTFIENARSVEEVIERTAKLTDEQLSIVTDALASADLDINDEIQEMFDDSEIQSGIETYAESKTSDAFKSYMLAISSYHPLDKDREYQLFERVANGDREARKRIAEANLRSVVYCAYRYMAPGLTMLDLIQEGNLGLMTAIDRFDYQKGYRFATYSTWWVLQRIRRCAVGRDNLIRIPPYMVISLRNIMRVKNSFANENGRAPTIEELSELTGYDVKKIKRIDSLPSVSRSLDEYITDEDGDVFADIIPDSNGVSPYELVEKELIAEGFSQCLERLTDRERTVIERLYGLNNHNKESLQSVGDTMGISKERVRQIREDVFKKLKHNRMIQSLAGKTVSYEPSSRSPVKNTDDDTET